MRNCFEQLLNGLLLVLESYNVFLTTYLCLTEIFVFSLTFVPSQKLT